MKFPTNMRLPVTGLETYQHIEQHYLEIVIWEFSEPRISNMTCKVRIASVGDVVVFGLDAGRKNFK